jgi:hypothetical protein
MTAGRAHLYLEAFVHRDRETGADESAGLGWDDAICVRGDVEATGSVTGILAVGRGRLTFRIILRGLRLVLPQKRMSGTNTIWRVAVTL